ncbi:putative acyl-CoA dehydrogenase AidB [Cyphellophora attinorum]|uniref:Putative acyl-CoA dehydrogenase AidB n=1 Tax=Cyphellophora attinorum TaxID=1664694 RepID=A0A0N0NQJ6_9EURO|nr:putative acyl-CoA dehydrogenase AidB [Phialophora attinorum]KPI43779.1 putative acyl-CoA dehydrogenase AidB [Phialophora attinorum]
MASWTQERKNHSTVDTGYTLNASPLENPVTSDNVFQRIIAWYLPPHIRDEVVPQLIRFGEEAVSPRVNDWIANAEKQEPYVKQYDAWGRRYAVDKLVTSEGWKQLGVWGSKNGVVARGYEAEFGSHRRLVQHSFNYIFSASSAVRSCPVSMSSGASRLVSKLLKDLPPKHFLHAVYQRLISRTDPWVSAQWMTERPGGSDVQNSETYATHSPFAEARSEDPEIVLGQGDYLLSGFKWFSSATDCDIALILARTEPAAQLSLFIAPTRITQPDGTLVSNGVRIHRMKKKMGTKELPTAELELRDMRAHLIGKPERGIATIALLLNVTRTHNFFVALSCWRRGLAIAKAFAKVRSTLDQPLATFPMHLRLLANLELKHRACMQLGFFTTALLSFADNGHPPETSSTTQLPGPGKHTEVLLRALTATSKAIICKIGCQGLQECQEAMGGVGYLDDPDDPEFNISRLYRDTAANMTWEGTTNVLASEVVRHLCNKDHLEVVDVWFRASFQRIQSEELKSGVEAAWSVLRARLAAGKNNVGPLLADGREIMFSFGWLVSSVLLCHDAQRDHEAIAAECARRWVLEGQGGYGEWVLPDVIAAARSQKGPDKISSLEAECRNWDCRIVWECDLPVDAALGYRPNVSMKARL